ncbi:MAG: NAD(P)/FAD-dependent oxidoreductase [Acidimicrobiales bacterium]|jgi:3-phenylpropionate/trans-cinnamate dioxygenase ferredoxin reductase component
MKGERTFVIVGAALAGAKAAETLRTEGFDGRVVLVGEEPVRPYERPPLSKEYLRGEKSFDQVAAVHPAGFYEEHDIELRTSTSVAAIDAVSSEVVLATGERIGYARLLLATGAVPRRLSVPGADLDGVLYLRTVADADVIAARIRSGARVVVIGAGWIGCEVAASARQLGSEVAMVEPSRLPLEGALGPEVGAIYRDLHAAHGVEMHFGARVESVQGTRSAEAVRLSDGTSIAADAVVVGVGAGPRTELAAAAGLDVGNGVVVDEHLASSVPGIYAAGDVANAFYVRYGTHIRLEHWSAALNQGPAAARAMLGGSDPYTKTPYFFSDQYDLGMEYRGYAPTFDRVVFRGDPSAGAFIAFWIAADRVVAAMNANIWDVGDAIEALLQSERAADPKRLADPDVDLVELAGPEKTSS